MARKIIRHPTTLQSYSVTQAAFDATYSALGYVIVGDEPDAIVYTQPATYPAVDDAGAWDSGPFYVISHPDGRRIAVTYDNYVYRYLPLGFTLVGGERGEANPYLLQDAFAVARATGTINGTAAEPGPGTRVVSDASGKITIASDEIVIAAGATAAFQTGPVLSLYTTPGLMLVQEFRYIAQSDIGWGWMSALTGSTGCFVMYPGIVRIAPVEGGTMRPNPGPVVPVAGASYVTAAIKREYGQALFIKIGSAWYLFWMHNILHPGTAVPYQAGARVNALGATIGSAGFKDFRATAGTWLPSPLVSDGFDRSVAALGLTDGAGHNEAQQGLAFGLGGDGRVWTARSGTWGCANAQAQATALAGGLAIATVETGRADVLLEAGLTRMSGSVGIVSRWVDASNHVRVYHDGTNVKVDKVVAGTLTNVSTVARTYVAGQRLLVMAQTPGAASSSFHITYGDVATVLTIADTALQTGTAAGLYTTDLSNTINDFAAWQIGGYGSGMAPTFAPTATLSVSAPQPFQGHRASVGTIPVAGTYTGGGTVDIEARWNGGSWATIDTGVTGAYSGSLTGCAAGTGSVDVRVVGTNTARSVAPIVVGLALGIWGQSNAAGAGTNKQVATHANQRAMLFGNDYRWKFLADSVDSNVGQVDTVSLDGLSQGSYWPLLATRIMTATGQPVYFVPCAMGGTQIASWQPGANHRDRTTLYGSGVYRCEAAGGVDAVLWHQGESDAPTALGRTSTAYYAGQLQALGDAVLADLGCPLVAAKIHLWTESPPVTATSLGYVNDAIEATIGTHNVLRGPDFRSPNWTIALHGTTDAELLDAATRWDAALAAAGL